MKVSCKFVLAFIALAFLYHGYSSAQTPPLKVCAGADDNSVYTKMAKDLSKYCGDDITVVHSPSSYETFTKLSNKECFAGLVQGDVFSLFAAVDPTAVNGMMNIFGLHTEAYHFATVAQAGGVMGIGGKAIQSTDDLVGLKIGVTPSGAISLKNFSRIVGLAGVEVKEYASIPDVVKAMGSKEVQGALFVTGAGNKTMNSLPEKFVFIPVSAGHANKLKMNGYVETKITYARTKGPMSTVATRAHLVSRKIGSTPMTDRMKQLRACVKSKLGDLQDGEGTSPSWSTAFPDAALNGATPLN